MEACRLDRVLPPSIRVSALLRCCAAKSGRSYFSTPAARLCRRRCGLASLRSD